MNPKIQRRKKLFDKYKENLFSILRLNKIKFNEEIPFVICPLCRRYFFEDSLLQSSENPLTIEHVPPESVGGKGLILTCKECNNIHGSDLDTHLTKRIKQHNFLNLKEGEKFSTTFIIDDEFRSDGYIEVSKNKNVNIVFQEERTNPKNHKLAKDIALAKKEKGKVTFKTIGYSKPKFNLAILRSAFLLVFEKFGYSFLFTRNSDIPRKMIMAGKIPSELKFINWNEQIPDELIGIHILKKPIELNSYFVVLKIKKDEFNKNFGVIIPGANQAGENIYENYSKLIQSKEDIQIEFEEVPNLNYINDLSKIMIPINAWGK